MARNDRVERLYPRLRALACRFWAIAPPVFDDYASRGLITAEDVMGLVTLLGHDPMTAVWVDKYLAPQVVERRADRVRRLNNQRFALMLANRAAGNTDEERQYLEGLRAALKTEVAGGAA